MPASAVAQDDDELWRTQEKMAELREGKDDLRGAYRIWRELLGQHPRSARVLDNVCRLALELKRFKEALDPARRLQQLDAQNPRHRTRLVSALVGSGLQAEALPHLQWLQRRAPQDVEVRRELADACQHLRRWSEALQHYSWLIARSPRDVDHRLARAALYGDMKQEKRQREELQLLLTQISPADRRIAEIHFQLAELYYHEEDYDHAEASLQAALRVAPAHGEARALRAKLQGERAAAGERAYREHLDAERYQDWLLDVQDRAEDF